MTKLFQIITDSSCDLPQSLADELDLRVLPLHVTIDGKTYNNYLDGREIAFKDFFDKLRAGSQGTTSAVNPEEFRAEMEPVLAAGLDVLYVGFSSGLSTTYQSGCIAADELREHLAEYGAEPKILVGDGAMLCYNKFEGQLENLSMAPDHLLHQRAGAMAELAASLLAEGKTVSSGELAPVYLRLPQAERELKLRQQKGE